MSCGLYMMVLGGMGVAVVAGLLRIGFDSWWWLLAVPVLPIVCMVASIPPHYGLAALEWLAYCLRRCPRCSARAWSWGFTQGFGL